MTHERWEEVKSMIKKGFTVLDEYEEELDPGVSENIEFEAPQGTMKVSFVRKPRVLGKDTHYARRGGSGVSVSYRYSADEEVTHLEVFRYDTARDMWVAIDATTLFR
ncbi:MAG: hypothetical protein A3B30_04275 [Candidatus Komeilibacteria bacterium RIFCSPLOWO2_01_FULL_52_15]|uniref:Uncharacterized protein n=2 Tax=Candidatus Komeiliibacteriota TaxID=1817908 RepID=A0A1G2BRA0_9BACT|nr:MAG: hypothetical protein A2677_04035 [Candidatus Komeilibacteria bacterium RIFCSPHIGHO2_01_FULL_52_14]OGY91099.1 MAG: hypothetical protein A3B30_04275 [Candidatus Komeilibacteria bacterium RIFCSPLOWO2_01_FULL_52_15]